MAVTHTQHGSAPNAPEHVAQRMQAGKISRSAPWLVLPLRTVLFPLIQAALTGAFLLSGRANPWEAASAWWPVYLILANAITFVILLALVRREGLSYADLWRNARRNLGSKRRETLIWVALILGSVVAGGVGFAGAAILLYGGQMPEFVSALPMWAAWLSLLVMPLSIALVELPAYFGYVMPRLEAATGRRWLPLLLAAFFLALQHSTLPLLFDLRFILFRFVQMILLALFLGLIYHRTRRLAPLLVLHFLADLQLGVTVFVLSI
jgi:membrane protease YdiL (CAAX protease family)